MNYESKRYATISTIRSAEYAVALEWTIIEDPDGTCTVLRKATYDTEHIARWVNKRPHETYPSKAAAIEALEEECDAIYDGEEVEWIPSVW